MTSDRKDHYIGVITSDNPDWQLFTQHRNGTSFIPEGEKTYMKCGTPVTVSFWFQGVFFENEDTARCTLHWNFETNTCTGDDHCCRNPGIFGRDWGPFLGFGAENCCLWLLCCVVLEFSFEDANIG
jgi:hypothetical protein